MKQYNEQELTTKIHTFLAKKLQQYPEIDGRSGRIQTAISPSLSTRLKETLTWVKPLATR